MRENDKHYRRGDHPSNRQPDEVVEDSAPDLEMIELAVGEKSRRKGFELAKKILQEEEEKLGRKLTPEEKKELAKKHKEDFQKELGHLLRDIFAPKDKE